MSTPAWQYLRFPEWSKFLNYLGDQREAVGTVVGPTLLGEYYRIVDVYFDPQTHRSRAELKLANPHDLGGLTSEGPQGLIASLEDDN